MKKNKKKHIQKKHIKKKIMKIPFELLRNISSFFEEWRILDMLAFSKTKTKTKTKTIPYRYQLVFLKKIKNIKQKFHWRTRTENTMVSIHIKNFKKYYFFFVSANAFHISFQNEIIWWEKLP